MLEEDTALRNEPSTPLNQLTLPPTLCVLGLRLVLSGFRDNGTFGRDNFCPGISIFRIGRRCPHKVPLHTGHPFKMDSNIDFLDCILKA
jgi:hypothetical protein